MEFLLKDSRIVKVWQNDSNRTKGRKYGAGKYRAAGLPDICGMLRGGRFFCIELKFGKGKPTPEQVEFIAHIKANFGASKVAWSLEEVREWLNDIFPTS